MSWPMAARLAPADAAAARGLAALDTRRSKLEASHAKARARVEAALTAARRALG